MLKWNGEYKMDEKYLYEMIYVVIYEGNVSSEGYDSEEKAFKYIQDRGGKQVQGWLFKDDEGKEYKIKEIKIV